MKTLCNLINDACVSLLIMTYAHLCADCRDPNQPHHPFISFKQGCIFHFNQLQFRQFRFIPYFLTDQPLRQRLSSVYGLPFLSVDYVIPAWSELKTAIFNLRPIAAISKYIAYFEKNWIFNNSYPIAMWNVSSAVEYEEPRTNNTSEGGNNGLARMFKSQLGCLSHSIQPSGIY